MTIGTQHGKIRRDVVLDRNTFRERANRLEMMRFRPLAICRVARSLIAGGLSTPFRDASAGVMVLFAVVHLDWLDGAA